MGLPVTGPLAEMRSPVLPAWCEKIIERLKRTIFKRMLESRPEGASVGPYTHGKYVGLVVRCCSFFQKDAPRILANEGLAELSVEAEEKISAGMGFEKHREDLLRTIGKPANDPVPTDVLVVEVAERQLDFLEHMQNVGLAVIPTLKPEDQSLFLEGLCEGHGLLLDDKGEFSGEVRRAEIYFTLLASWVEIEQMRQAKPAKSRPDLLRWLEKQCCRQIVDSEQKFNEACREIGLDMKGSGRPRKASK